MDGRSLSPWRRWVLDYRIVPVNIYRGEQYEPDFLAISPNNRMPAIVDHDPADGGRATCGVRIRRHPDLPGREDRPLPADGPARTQDRARMALVATGRPRPDDRPGRPFQALCAGGPIPYAIERYRSEMLRLYGVLDRRLEGRDHIADEYYSIADMACWPWVITYKGQKVDLDAFPNVKALVQGAAAAGRRCGAAMTPARSSAS